MACYLMYFVIFSVCVCVCMRAHERERIIIIETLYVGIL